MSELYHHGVKGMKWGVRRQRRKALNQARSDARVQYRNRTSKAFDEYEKSIADIEKSYKRGQNLSKKDQAREAAVEKKYRDAEAKAKSDYDKSVTKAKADYKKAKEKDKAATKQNIKKSIKKGSEKASQALAKLSLMALTDQIFFDGAGTKAVKTGVKYTGRAVVTAYMKARGATDIRWYDNGILD